jgi:hypothetical protein
MGKQYSVRSINDIKDRADKFVEDVNRMDPGGYNLSESDLIRFITAFSVSSFFGIQNPKYSAFSYDSMVKTLKSHANPRIIKKTWLISNLDDARQILLNNPYLMQKDYADLMMNAKVSSSSMDGYKDYREFVFNNDIQSIISIASKTSYEIYVGTRIDRRGKFRLICSFNGAIRAIDYVLNNHSYDLCHGDSIYGVYTTEGYDDQKLWTELAIMAKRGDYVLICLDYSGYDTQISLDEYIEISRHINPNTGDITRESMKSIFYDWLSQPKSLLAKGSGGNEVLLGLYKTLASGLHGTHSFENLIGISTYRQAVNMGIRTNYFKTNGDDQNIKVHKLDVEEYLKFISQYFIISEVKSLIGHKLGVWSKLWFGEGFHPAWEIGTFRSIWEREKGDVDLVEPSKLLSNYAKVVQTIIMLIRSRVHMSHIISWTIDLCESCYPIIDPYRIPKFLTNYDIIKVGKHTKPEPAALRRHRRLLESKNFDMHILGATDFYTLFKSMYCNNYRFDFNVKRVEYHPYGTILRFERGFDYSINPSKYVPFMFRKLVKPSVITRDRRFCLDILSATKSYCGPVQYEFEFTNIFELAVAINDRNRLSWINVEKNS